MNIDKLIDRLLYSLKERQALKFLDTCVSRFSVSCAIKKKSSIISMGAGVS